MEVFPPLYSPLWSIFFVHLFIIQLCTQVSVMLSSFSGFLWAVVVESTIQKSSPHKCGQESCCSAFNVVVAAFPLDISVFLSLLYTSEVYLHCWNFLEGYPSQNEVHFTDIRQVWGGWLSRSSGFEHFSICSPTMGLSQTFPPPRMYSC